jgi:rubrerythrin
MSRERVIVEIQNLDQALKVEETIKTGYCDPIAENLLAWMAVEEDLSDSYDKLSAESPSKEVKETIAALSKESKNNVKLLQEFLDTVEEFGAARDRRRAALERLAPGRQ